MLKNHVLFLYKFYFNNKFKRKHSPINTQVFSIRLRSNKMGKKIQLCAHATDKYCTDKCISPLNICKALGKCGVYCHSEEYKVKNEI